VGGLSGQLANAFGQKGTVRDNDQRDHTRQVSAAVFSSR
jgi:hypothetical protein